MLYFIFYNIELGPTIEKKDSFVEALLFQSFLHRQGAHVSNTNANTIFCQMTNNS